MLLWTYKLLLSTSSSCEALFFRQVIARTPRSNSVILLKNRLWVRDSYKARLSEAES